MPQGSPQAAAMSEGQGMQPSGIWALQPVSEMTPSQLNDWQALLEQRTGLVINEARRSFLQTNLSARMRELGLNSYASYYQLVSDGPRGAVEWSTLLDRLTIQETRFMRHPPSFEVLSRYLAERLAQEGPGKPWSLWSVGCSTGEEAYSMAICAAQILEAQELPLNFGVTATDISLHALARTRAGVYSQRRLQLLEQPLYERYFVPLDEGRWQVVPKLLERVAAARLNVLDLARAPFTALDVIFCQNLLIYFRRWRRREVLNRLVERLAPGGLLLIGVGEVSDWQHPELEAVNDERVLAFTRKK